MRYIESAVRKFVETWSLNIGLVIPRSELVFSLSFVLEEFYVRQKHSSVVAFVS